MYWINLPSFLSSARVQDWTFVARSLIGLTMSGRARRASHSAFMRMRQALGASSPLFRSSSGVIDPSGRNGVEAFLTFSSLVMDL